MIKVELGFSVLIHRDTTLSVREVEGDIMLYLSSVVGIAVVVGLFRRYYTHPFAVSSFRGQTRIMLKEGMG